MALEESLGAFPRTAAAIYQSNFLRLRLGGEQCDLFSPFRFFCAKPWVGKQGQFQTLGN